MYLERTKELYYSKQLKRIGYFAFDKYNDSFIGIYFICADGRYRIAHHPYFNMYTGYVKLTGKIAELL